MVTETAGGVSLTDVDQRLVDHVTRGELLDLAAAEPVNEAAMRTWDSSRTIRAGVLRDILRGRLAPDPDPHGLRLRGARIAGQLDLDNLTTAVGVELVDCLLGEGLVARDATLPFLTLSGCRLEHPARPPLAAERLTAAALFLKRAVITADCKDGAVGLAGAHLGGLDCTDATMRNDSGPALDADSVQVNQNVLLHEGFRAIGAGELGAVRLLDAHVGGLLDCVDGTMRNDSGPALAADGLQVEQAVYLRGGFRAIGAGELGAVRLLDAHVGGYLDCTDATMRNDSGPALAANSLQVDQNVLLRGFEAVGAGEGGAVGLADAHVGGTLDSDGATMRNDSGPALAAEGLQVDQEVFLRGFEAVGAGERGAVRLLGGHVGRLECDGAMMRNGSGPALDAEGLQVDQTVFLRDGFEAVGAGERGAVRLASAHVGGELDCHGAMMRNDSGPALYADGLQADQRVLLSSGFEAVAAGSDVTLRLPQARIGGVLAFAPERLEHLADPQARLALDGLTYAGLPAEIASRDWLRLLREATPSYAAQPYQQFAAAHRAAGHDGEVRRILMAQRQDQIDRKALTGRGERAWARLTGLTLGYGYQPWRALLALLAVAMIAVVLALTLGAHGGVARTNLDSRTVN